MLRRVFVSAPNMIIPLQTPLPFQLQSAYYCNRQRIVFEENTKTVTSLLLLVESSMRIGPGATREFAL